MDDVRESEHHMDTLVYRVRIEVVAEILDAATDEVVASGSEEEVKKLYRTLKRRS